MADLMKDFFNRDLTDAEDQTLADLLAASPQNSLRFAELARQAYRKTGLPDGDGPGSGGLSETLGPLAPLFWRGLVLLVTIGLTLFLFLKILLNLKAPAASPPPAVVQAAPAPESVRTIHKTHLDKPSRPNLHSPASLKPPMVKPVAYDPAKRYEGLDIMVEQKNLGLVTVRALDGSRNEVRLLFAGMLKPGKWDFLWDGKQDNGAPTRPGTYLVEVQTGGQVQIREIVIHGEP